MSVDQPSSVKSPPSKEPPRVVVRNDYDGAFEATVRSWIKRKQDADGLFNHREVVIDAGPYRSCAVSYESCGDRLCFDFYSALRCGFGSLSDTDVHDLVEVL